MEGILKSIKNEFSENFFDEVFKFVLIGSRISNNYRNDVDFDIIVIVENNCDTYELIKKMSSYIYIISINFKASIGIYPIRNEDFKKGKSQFIDNVIINGIEF